MSFIEQPNSENARGARGDSTVLLSLTAGNDRLRMRYSYEGL